MCSAFPELEGEFEDDDGEHYKMERFADYTIKQILSANWAKLKSCFSFQEERLSILNPELENAINVSYCEALLLGKVRNEMNTVITYMGPLLTKQYKEYEEYYNGFSKKHKSSNKK